MVAAVPGGWAVLSGCVWRRTWQPWAIVAVVLVVRGLELATMVQPTTGALIGLCH